MNWVAKVLFVLACAFSVSASNLFAGHVRLSFLTDVRVLEDTMNLLRERIGGTESFEALKTSVLRHNESPLGLDFGKFPAANEGFYSFNSVSNLVTSLSGKLSEAEHGDGLNCFDALQLFCRGKLTTSLGPDERVGHFLVGNTGENGRFTIYSATNPATAFEIAYPDWYRKQTVELFPLLMHGHRVSLTACLFSFYELPETASELTLERSVFKALKQSWKTRRLEFPRECEVVLCHEVSSPKRLFGTSHVGVVIRSEQGKTYLEKAGCKGPFVRLDYDDDNDLIVWLGAIFLGGEKLGYTHHFATFNDTRIRRLYPNQTRMMAK